MAKGKHDIRNWCPRQHKRCSAQKGARVNNKAAQQHVRVSNKAAQQHVRVSSTETQIQQQLRRRDNTCSHMYTQRHKYSSSYDEEITRAGAGTTLSPTKKRHPLLWMEAKVKCIKNGRRQTGEEDRKTGEMKYEAT